MNICAWTAVLRGDLKLSWGGMGVGVSPIPAELYQRGEGAQLFLFPLFYITFPRRSFPGAGFHFGNFLITQTRPPVFSQDPLPLSLK